MRSIALVRRYRASRSVYVQERSFCRRAGFPSGARDGEAPRQVRGCGSDSWLVRGEPRTRVRAAEAVRRWLPRLLRRVRRRVLRVHRGASEKGAREIPAMVGRSRLRCGRGGRRAARPGGAARRLPDAPDVGGAVTTSSALVGTRFRAKPGNRGARGSRARRGRARPAGPRPRRRDRPCRVRRCSCRPVRSAARHRVDCPPP